MALERSAPYFDWRRRCISIAAPMAEYNITLRALNIFVYPFDGAMCVYVCLWSQIKKE